MKIMGSRDAEKELLAATVLINTRVDRDFISKEFVRRNRLRRKRKTNPYLLNTINKI